MPRGSETGSLPALLPCGSLQAVSSSATELGFKVDINVCSPQNVVGSWSS